MSEMKLTMTTGERRAVKWSVEYSGALSAIDRATVLNLIADIDALEAENGRLREALTLCEHKIDQHLQGQYPDGAALRAALAFARAQQPSPAQDKEQG